MIVRECPFNPDVDLNEVDQIGYVNMREAWETHTVPGNLNPEDLQYNDIEDPASIAGKPSDIFDAVTAAQNLNKAAVAASSSSDSKESE